MTDFYIRPEAAARFDAARSAKADLFTGAQLFLGLNCFEPGQGQAVHRHAGADKFYYVLVGRATVTIGDESRAVNGGMLVWAPAGVPHGVSEVTERTVMLVGIAPPPRSVPAGPGTQPAS